MNTTTIFLPMVGMRSLSSPLRTLLGHSWSALKKLLHDLQKCKESGCYDKELRTYRNGMDGKTYYDISDLWRILHKIAGARDGSVIGMENGGIVEVSEMCVF